MEHDLGRFATTLNAKLASRARHVSVVLGAGMSRACGLPDVSLLDAHLRDALEGESLRTYERLAASLSLEQILSRIRRISALLVDDAGQEVDGLTGLAANELDAEICEQIIIALNGATPNLEPMIRLASWAGRAAYHRPLEIFTVNYDLLIECGLEELKVPYFDGFVGHLQGRFRSDLIESGPEAGIPAFMVRLWKLHGSINWLWRDDPRPEVVRLGAAVESGAPAAIYPSDAKYEESRRVPFVVLQDRFRRSLQEPESVVLISGFAFGDDHLNEMIFDAARRCPRSEFVAFCFSSIPAALAAAAEITPNLQVVAPQEAIIGGRRGPWQTPSGSDPVLWEDGKCRLGDFGQLSQFLARSAEPNAELEELLGLLLAKAATGGD